MAWFSPPALLLPQMIDNNVRAHADKLALATDAASLSWSQLDQATRQVAAALAGLGLQRGDRVAVLMSNSAAMAESLFGIVRGGFVAVPLNVSIADAAVCSMLDDCSAGALIATPDHAKRIDANRAALPASLRERCVCSEPREGWIALDDVRASAGGELELPELRPEEHCNIIYSSGTTGLPKGIVHDHRCRAAWAYDMAVGLRYHSGARTLCSLGLYSNISWVAMLATILAGGTLYVMPRFDVRTCLEWIERYAITHTTMVPVQLQRLLEAPEFAPEKVMSLQSLMCCGSPLPAVEKRRVVAGFGSAFMELYGLTEGLATILSPEDMSSALDSVGRPCPGQQIRILDDDDRDCAAGVSGEIIGRGPLQMAGYHGRDAENAAATWTDPQGNRWLRTGDIGHLDSAGFLHLVDRKKDMIISGGQNIYPADIEAVMIAHEAVAEVAVIGASSARWGETPLAVVVPRNDLDAEALLSWVNERVGRQQRVAAIELIDELPRNPNGKVLKRELRERFAHLTF